MIGNEKKYSVVSVSGKSSRGGDPDFQASRLLGEFKFVPPKGDLQHSMYILAYPGRGEKFSVYFSEVGSTNGRFRLVRHDKAGEVPIDSGVVHDFVRPTKFVKTATLRTMGSKLAEWEICCLPCDDAVIPALEVSPQSAAVVVLETVLSQSEEKELAECEVTIERGWSAFVEAGRALARIRDRKLYRGKYATFAEYCRRRWHYGRSHAYRLICASEVAVHLAKSNLRAPTHESQVRPLVGLKPEKVLTAWQRALEQAKDGAITATLVKTSAALIEGHVQRTPTSAGKSKARLIEEISAALTKAENAVRRRSAAKTVLGFLAQAKEFLEQLR